MHTLAAADEVANLYPTRAADYPGRAFDGGSEATDGQRERNPESDEATEQEIASPHSAEIVEAPGKANGGPRPAVGNPLAAG